MTPAAYRARLDRSLADRGGDMLLRRRVPNSSPSKFYDQPCRGALRGYQPHEIAGDIKHGDSSIILSPTLLLTTPTAWPAGVSNSQEPIIGDYIFARGRNLSVLAADVVRVNGEMVRINLQARG